MNCELLQKYGDFIMAYERLFHVKSNETFEDIYNLISSILITKYKRPIAKIILNILSAIQFNYRYIDLYVKIINQIISNFSIKYDVLFNNKKIQNIQTELKLSQHPENPNKMKYDQKIYPKENEIHFIIMHDQIDKFREYIIQESLDEVSIYIPTFSNLTPIEVCCYYGSANIFYFLKLNFNVKLSSKLLLYSIIGGNTDIINDCMKNYDISKQFLQHIIVSHNNDMLEYLIRGDLIHLEDIDNKPIILSDNLKALLLMFEKNQNSIFPWCAAFPQSIDILRNNDINLNKSDYNFHNLLHFAAASDNMDICKFLLGSSKFDKNNANRLGKYSKTPLYYAVKNNNTELVSLLFYHGASADLRLSTRKTAFHYAAKYNRIEMIKILVEHGADINATYLPDAQTALHNAAKNNYKETAELLISFGADVNSKDKFMKTPLHYAASCNSIKVADILITHGANINAIDVDRQNALHIAVQKRYNTMAEYFVKNGVDINAQNNKGQCAIHIAAGRCSMKLIRFLISKKADISIKDNDGHTPIYYAIEKQRNAIINLFTSLGAVN